jgi:glyoxalase family protein
VETFTTMGIHHVSLVAADVRRTVAFYRDVLGLALLRRGVDPADPLSQHLHFGGGPGALVCVVEATRPRGNWGVGGVHHTAFGVADDDALLRWKRRLADHGVDVYGPVDRHWFHSLYFSDPDGQVLEIATRGPGYALDEPADRLGEAEIAPPAENISGHRDEAAMRARTWPDPVPEITPEMALDGIHHISGITDDLGRADGFLRAALGLRLVKRTVNQDDGRTPHWFWARYDGREVAPHSAYSLFGWPRGGRRARPGVGQTHHVAFRAPDAGHLLAWRDHLLSLGVEAGAVEEEGPFRVLRFPAPDGQLLELAADSPGF